MERLFRLEIVISVILMIAPFILIKGGAVHCLAVSPAVVLSLIFVVLYLVDQVQNYAEQLYLTMQIILIVIQLFVVLIQREPTGSLYALFYCHLLVVLALDLFYIVKERGYALKEL